MSCRARNKSRAASGECPRPLCFTGSTDYLDINGAENAAKAWCMARRTGGALDKNAGLDAAIIALNFSTAFLTAAGDGFVPSPAIAAITAAVSAVGAPAAFSCP